MRARLFIVFLVPLTCILLALGGAYAWSASRSIQQEFTSQQLGDLSYFVTGARHALRAGNPAIIESELARYGELYSANIAVIDRTGSVWASGGGQPSALDEETASQVALALSGRRSDIAQAAFPWTVGDSVVVEPVFDDGSVIGAVMISASSDGPRSEITLQWILLVVTSIFVVLLLVFVVLRLASWVLQPMRRVDRALAAIEHGDMEARIDDDTGPPEMRRMIRLFNQMAEEIERVVSRQQEFAMNASHELRNPLGALLMRVEYLATGLDASWEGDVEKTREEGRRMSRILDTLLFMARSGKKDSLFAPVDLCAVVNDRIEAWGAIAAKKQVTFDRLGAGAGSGSGAGSDTGVVQAITDRTAIESALDAVLDNALKFAPVASNIEVDVRGGDECTISVRDYGPGLDASEIERVTDRFWRSKRDQNVPGSGLGLAIASDLLESLGGRVTVAPHTGGGLIVTLILPGKG